MISGDISDLLFQIPPMFFRDQRRRTAVGDLLAVSHALMVPGKVGHEELGLVLPPTRPLQLPVHLDNLGMRVQPCLCLGVIGPLYLLSAQD